MASSVCEVTIKWSGQEYKINGLTGDQKVADLKNAIKKETGVLPERQKLLNLKHKGKPADDEVSLSALNLKPNMKIMMMGTREEALKDVMTPPEEMPEVVNDFDIEEDEIAIENREEYLSKIERRIRDYNVEILNEPRPGKHLLVLDIDYTLFDHKSVAETGTELMRPYLHEFLSSAYEDYDIVIWSATGMKWIKAKMEELGMEKNPNYKLCFYLDNLAMITVHAPKYGVIDVKPLGVIWGRYKQWSPKNTIMFDDIRRNFIMNPQSGLKIKPFRQAHVNRGTDRELLKLAKYLKAIAPLESFTELNHRKWEKYHSKKDRHHHDHYKRRRSSDKDNDRNDDTPSADSQKDQAGSSQDTGSS